MIMFWGKREGGGGGGGIGVHKSTDPCSCLVPICQSRTILFKDGSELIIKKGADPSLNEIVSFFMWYSFTKFFWCYNSYHIIACLYDNYNLTRSKVVIGANPYYKSDY